MIGWRLCRRPFADLGGEGARLYGGRWNSRGLPVVHMADAAALAVLEVRVHLDLPPELIPDDYVLMAIDLADLPIERITEPPASTQHFGDRWLREQRTPLLLVPSAIVAESGTLLLNPAHARAARARILTTRAFSFDPRLWQPAPGAPA